MERLTSIRLEAERLARQLPPLRMASGQVAYGTAPGMHGLRRAGAGDAFWQYRHYRPGDPARLIDWRRTARGDPVLVREREAETVHQIWLWADRSPSMDFSSGSALPTKRERAGTLLLATAILLLQAGEQVHLLGLGREAFRGPQALDRLVGTLEEARGASDGFPAMEALPPHARLIWIGDLIEPADEIDARLRAFTAARVRGHILEIADPAEEDLDLAGRVLFEGVENEGELLVRNVGQIRERYMERREAHRQAVRATASRLGWTLGHHRTDRPAATALLALAHALSIEPDDAHR